MRRRLNPHNIEAELIGGNPMPGQPPSQGSRPPGSIDFELTDFDRARQALDELPPGVREVAHLAPGYWEQRRRKAQPSDRALTGMAIDWVIALPAAVRPRTLCEQFPRIANRIAESWNEHANTAEALGRLLVDERGGRHGLPGPVQQEIRQLREYALQLAGQRR
jgi:hypothetical protein